MNDPDARWRRLAAAARQAPPRPAPPVAGDLAERLLARVRHARRGPADDWLLVGWRLRALACAGVLACILAVPNLIDAAERIADRGFALRDLPPPPVPSLPALPRPPRLPPPPRAPDLGELLAALPAAPARSALDRLFHTDSWFPLEAPP